jgi:hypothetical protein
MGYNIGMTLATHGVFGAMVASFVPHRPFLGFVIGFLSHFLLDSLPHYDYDLGSSVPNTDIHKRDIRVGKKFFADLVPLGLDCLGGFIIAAAIFSGGSIFVALLGAIGGVLPDALQFVYMKTRSKLLFPLQRFHTAIQSRNLFRHRPLPGIGIQFAVILFAGAALRYFGIL